MEGCHAGALKVSVAAPPERGKANRALEALLAEALGLPRRFVRLVGGETARDKTVVILGLAEPELRRRLAALLPPRLVSQRD